MAELRHLRHPHLTAFFRPSHAALTTVRALPGSHSPLWVSVFVGVDSRLSPVIAVTFAVTFSCLGWLAAPIGQLIWVSG